MAKTHHRLLIGIICTVTGIVLNYVPIDHTGPFRVVTTMLIATGIAFIFGKIINAAPGLARKVNIRTKKTRRTEPQ